MKTLNFEDHLSNVWREGSQGKMWMSGGRVWGPNPEVEEFKEQLAHLPLHIPFSVFFQPC